MRWAGARQGEGGRWAGGPLLAGPGALPQGGQDWKELFLQEEEEGAPIPVEDELALHDNGFLSKNEVLRSKVSRLTERLRKRYPTNNFGTVRGQGGAKGLELWVWVCGKSEGYCGVHSGIVERCVGDFLSLCPY